MATAGGIEEDFIKCMAPTYVGKFELKGCDLRKRGINRIGNLLVPNDNYCAFEDWIMPILDQMLLEQKEQVGTGNKVFLERVVCQVKMYPNSKQEHQFLQWLRCLHKTRHFNYSGFC